MSSSLVPKMTSSTMPTAAASSAVSRAHPKCVDPDRAGGDLGRELQQQRVEEQDQDEAQPDGVGHPQRGDDRREEGVQDADQRGDEDGAPEAGDRDAGHQPRRHQERERAEEPRDDEAGRPQARALGAPRLPVGSWGRSSQAHREGRDPGHGAEEDRPANGEDALTRTGSAAITARSIAISIPGTSQGGPRCSRSGSTTRSVIERAMNAACERDRPARLDEDLLHVRSPVGRRGAHAPQTISASADGAPHLVPIG